MRTKNIESVQLLEKRIINDGSTFSTSSAHHRYELIYWTKAYARFDIRSTFAHIQFHIGDVWWFFNIITNLYCRCARKSGDGVVSMCSWTLHLNYLCMQSVSCRTDGTESGSHTPAKRKKNIVWYLCTFSHIYFNVLLLGPLLLFFHFHATIPRKSIFLCSLSFLFFFSFTHYYRSDTMFVCFPFFPSFICLRAHLLTSFFFMCVHFIVVFSPIAYVRSRRKNKKKMAH